VGQNLKKNYLQVVIVLIPFNVGLDCLDKDCVFRKIIFVAFKCYYHS
jgi:hypothetical protein